MITITATEPISQYSEYAVDLALTIPDECTAIEAVSAYVAALRAAGYIDSSIYLALSEAASDVEESVTVSNKSIKEYND